MTSMRPRLFFTMLAVSIVPLLSVLSGCTAVDASSTASGNIVTGPINVIGNDPFTRIAIEDHNGKMVVLECTKDTESVLRANQGRTARVEYEQGGQTPYGQAARVVHVQIIVQ